MAKRLNVSLGFTADTAQASAAIKQLQMQLTNLINNPGQGKANFQLTEEIQQATHAAAELQAYLTKAINTDTGKLNFQQLSSALKLANKDLGSYGDQLLKLGPAGREAFSSLVTSVAQAEIPIKRTNTWLQQMGNTLKNSIRWQISSSMIHGFMGSVQKAYGYVQDLNESLNNIRIVTGQNTDQMAAFAEQANKAAKNLSTSTLNYTDAALIYYQQGLDDQQVKERTDVTVKLANVSRQSAEEVSDQMTAIWNNFAKGGENLEYYADIITALGAATASSSEEISTGLEKFAAIADTVGLSYENASAALATITATTRQSADTVGTGLRTLFSRLQSLSLGETLDDGVTLTKYTKALKTVGVDALDTAGGLRDMDDILEDLAGKWQNLGNEQKTALAQTVGGVRQYTTLIALMDNWDFMEKNQQIAANAAGTLQEQADIYAESWEAARKRVQASLEEIYSTLLDDKFFIGMNKGFAEIIESVSRFIDSVGGIKGVLISIGAIVTNVFGKQFAQNLRNAGMSILSMTQTGRDYVAQQKQNQVQSLMERFNPSDDATNYVDAAKEASLTKQTELQVALAKEASHMNETEMQIAESIIAANKAYGERAMELARTADAAEEEYQSISAANEATARAAIANAQNGEKVISTYNTAIRQLTTIKQLQQDASKIKISGDESAEDLQKIQQELLRIKNEGKIDIDFNLEDDVLDARQLEQALEQIKNQLGGKAAENLRTAESFGVTASAANAEADAFNRATTTGKQAAAATKLVGDHADKSVPKMKQLSQTTYGAADKFVAAASAMMTFGMALNSIKGLLDVWNDPDSTGFEKMVTTLTTLGMVSTMIVSTMKNLTNVFGAIVPAATAAAASEAAVGTAAASSVPGIVTMGSALWAALAPILPIVAAIGALIAVLVLLGNRQTAAEKKLDNLKTGFENLSDSVSRTRDTFNDLKSSFDNYENIIHTLETCKQGTEEWTDALIEAKNVYDELSNKYGDFIDLYEDETGEFAKALNPETGIFEFSDDFIDWAQKHEQAVMSAQTVAQQDVSRQIEATQIEVDKDSIGTQMRSILGSVYGETSDVTGQAIVGLMQNDTFINGLLDFFKNNWGDIEDIDVDNFLENINSLISSELENVLLANAGWTGPNAKEAVINDINEKGLAFANIPDGFQIVKNDEGIVTDLVIAEERLSQVQELMGDEIKTSLDEQADRWDQLFTDINEVNADQLSYDTEESVNGVVTSLLGQLVVNGLADVDTVAYLQNNQASKDAIQHIYDSIKEDVKAQTNEELWEEYKKANPQLKNVEEFKMKDGQLSYELDGETISESVDGIQSTLAALRMIQAADKWVNSDTGENILDVPQANIAKDKLKTNEQFNDFNGWDEFIDSIDESKVEEFAKKLDEIDWNTAELEDVEEIFKDVGYEANSSELQLDKLFAVLSKIAKTDASSALSDIFKGIQDLGKIGDGLSAGDIISGDDMNTLLQANPMLSNYFSMLADGTFQLTGDVSEFKSVLDSISLQPLIDYSNTLAQKQADLEQSKGFSLGAIGMNADDKFNAYTDQENFAQKQLTYLANSQYEDQGQVANWQNAIDTGNGLTAEDFSNIAAAITECGDQTQYFKDQLDSVNAQQQALNDAINQQDYADRITNAGLDFEEVESQAERLQDQFEDLNYEYGDMEQAAKDSAIANQRLNRGIEDLADNLDDYVDSIKHSDKDTAEYSKAMDGMKDIFADIYNLADGDMLSDNFISDLVEDGETLQKIADGDLETIENLRMAVADDIVQQIILDIENPDVANDVATLWTEAQNILDSYGDLTVGTHIDGTSEFVTKLNEMIAAAGMTKEQVTSLLGSMGMSAKLTQTYQEQTFSVPEYTTEETVTQTPAGGGENGAPATFTKVSHTYQSGMVEVTGQVPVVAIETESDGNGSGGGIDIIGSGGGVNKGNKGGYSGGKKGGGGKGGGGGGSKAKDQKKVTDEQDRYHEIKQVIEDLTRQEDMLADAKDRAWGAARLAYIDQEKNKLGQLIDKQQVYLNQINSNLANDRSAIAAYGAQFDKAGRITNYNDLIAQQVNKFNNSARGDSDEEAYETFKKALEQYEETLNLQEEAQQEYVDLMNQLYDKQLEYITEAVDMNESVAQDQLEYLDYMLDKIDDDAFSAAEAIALLGEETATTLEQIDNYRKGIEDILNNHDSLTADQREAIMNGTIDPETLKNLDFTADEIDTIRDYKSELLELNTTLREIREEIQEKLMDAYDAWNEKIEDQIDLYDHYEDIMEDYEDIVGLVGQDILGITDEMMSQFADIQMNNSINRLQSTRENYERLREQEAEARRQLAEAERSGNEQEIKLWRETVDEMAETTREAEEEFMSTWVDTLEKAADKLQAAVERSTKAFEKGLAGNYGSLDSLRDFYDMQRESDDLKLKDYEKIYELSKLNRDIQSHIDDTDNVKAKKMLRDFQKEINDLQDSEGEMTEQQLQRLQKEYDLKLAQIALEEAQNAKDTVRLTKDSEGNWSYVYTAEEEDVSVQMQEYEDKLYEYQSLLEEQRQAIADFGLECIQEYEDMYAEIMSDVTMNEEERNAKLAELQAWLNEQLQYQLEEGEAITQAQSELYQVDWQNYSDLTGYKISADDLYQDHFNETLLAQMLGVQTEQELFDKVIAGMQEMQGECNQALDEYKNETDRIMEAAGTSVEGYRDTMTDAYNDIDEATEQTKEEISNLKDEAVSAFDEMSAAVSEWATNYAQTIDQIVAKNELLTQGLDALVKAQTQAAQALMPEEAEDDTVPENTTAAAGSSGGTGGSGAYGNQVEWKGNSGKRYFYTASGTYHLTGTHRNNYAGSDPQAREIQQAFDRVGYSAVVRWTGTGGILDMKKLGFATGGYTGDWLGNDGRLAFLHQKELVLNKEDTSNLLATVDLVRQISRIIDINAASQAGGLGLLSAVAAKTEPQTLEQDVTIHAEFPNVQDHNEIEQAFNNLVNAASQFANRKNR